MSGNEDCCTSILVSGGTFNRSNDPSYAATVSAFRLDKFEITIGRYRKFVAQYSQTMIAAGSGKNPNNTADKGWDSAWNAQMLTPAVLQAVLKCSGNNWTDTPQANENRPVGCLDWYMAQAFCIWDGGRLPTEAEWNFAAAGGSEQRAYPWSSPPASLTIDSTYAVYDTGASADVGSKSPKGDGKFSHADLAGNLFEWVQPGGSPPTVRRVARTARRSPKARLRATC